MADRGWMYSGWKRGKATDEWYENTKEFLDLAFSNPNVVQNGEIKCPCSDCRNYNRKNRDGVELDLCHFGFKRNYTVWTEHGERRVHITNHAFVEVGDMVRMDNMVADLATSDGAIRKSEVLAVAKQHNIRSANSLSYHDLLRRNRQLEKKCKKVDVVIKHLKLLYAKSGLPVPEDLEDDLMADCDPELSSPYQDDGDTPLTGSSHAEHRAHTTPQSRQHGATPQHTPND